MRGRKKRISKIEADRRKRQSLRSNTIRGSGFRVNYAAPRRVKRRAPLVQWGKVIERKVTKPPSLSPDCVSVITNMNASYKRKIQKQIRAKKEGKQIRARQRTTAKRTQKLNANDQATGRRVIIHARPSSAPVKRAIPVVVKSTRHNPQYRTTDRKPQSAHPRAWMTLQNGYTPLAVRAQRLRAEHRPESAPLQRHILSRTAAQTQSILSVNKEIKACKREVRTAVAAVMMRCSANNHSRLGKLSRRVKHVNHHMESSRRRPDKTPTIPMVVVAHRNQLYPQP